MRRSKPKRSSENLPRARSNEVAVVLQNTHCFSATEHVFSDVILQTIHSEGTSFSDCAIDQAAEGGSRLVHDAVVMKEAMAILRSMDPMERNPRIYEIIDDLEDLAARG